MNRSKGSDFERAICKQLSLWWTDGERDDVFWRTAMSGGRATVRRKSGKGTEMQYGDISATDPIGVPLIRCLTIELKRGYGKASPFDLLDANMTKTLEWPLFLKQAKAAQESAGTPWWSLIFQRDRKKTCIAIPFALWVKRPPSFSDDENRIMVRAAGEDMVVLLLEEFLLRYSPQWFITSFEVLET